MTTEQLYEIIRIQQDEINQLRDDLKYLKDWSDLNDYWLREMIDTLTEMTVLLMTIVTVKNIKLRMKSIKIEKRKRINLNSLPFFLFLM